MESQKLQLNINWNGTNESGFTALPAGKLDGYDGSHWTMGTFGHFWGHFWSLFGNNFGYFWG